MKQGYFGRIFIVYGAIVLLAVLVTELSVTNALRDGSLNALRDSLATQASLIARDVAFLPGRNYDARCRELKKVIGARVTVIAADGRVLGDSDHASSTMDNHRDRIEIQQAGVSGAGMAVRRSDTLGVDLLYVARKSARPGGGAGYVRVSVPLGELDRAVTGLRIKVLGMVLALVALTALFPFWQIERLRRITVQMRDFAAALARGDLGRRLFLHRAGEFEEIAGSLNDMAASLQDEVTSLRDEKTKFETALLGISDGVLLLDRAGRVELVNRSFQDMFGVGADAAGRPFLEIVRNHQLADIVREAHEHRRPAAAEIEIALPRQLALLATALPIAQEVPAEGPYRGTVVALHDITQLKKLEQVRKDFVANVSHEIRTPITAIRGFAETLLSGALEDRDHARRFVETIRSNSERISSLVDDLMTISKIELGVIRIDMTDIAFEDVAETVLTLLREKAEQKGISFTTAISPGLGMIRADRDRLIQIMTNLADNAIKFTESGGVTVGMRDENGTTVLFVQDTGIGVSEKHLPRLGERFYRVDTARSRSMGGTGLGLAIVKHLVKAQGWEMRIESVPGKGTTVSILL